jgi:hypothetical protein
MAEKTTAYKVGRGKPPAHSQFKKGQSGNPGGKPGPVKSMQVRLKLALDASLCADALDLKFATSATTLDDIVKNLVLSAARGNTKETRLLLSLMDKLDKPQHGEPSQSEDESGESDRADDKTGASTLSQGRSQGRIEKVTPPNGETLTEQAVEPSGAQSSGKTEEAAAPRIVQQGD